jgi:hypothetical protein
MVDTVGEPCIGGEPPTHARALCVSGSVLGRSTLASGTVRLPPRVRPKPACDNQKYNSTMPCRRLGAESGLEVACSGDGGAPIRRPSDHAPKSGRFIEPTSDCVRILGFGDWHDVSIRGLWKSSSPCAQAAISSNLHHLRADPRESLRPCLRRQLAPVVVGKPYLT